MVARYRRGEAFRKNASPLQRGRLVPGSLGAIIGDFKSVSARRINRIRKTPGEPVWQRNYYEHVIRNEDELNLIRRYIRINPLKWQYDRENPSRLVDEDYERDWGWVEKPTRSEHFRGDALT